ncbi:MAG: hypothetical protein K6E49_06090 [Lachnospiraceae bacterium]|nr:hypothetical protein [Lachnospiraceae bacterium]
MSKESEKGGRRSGREIKQVYLSEDGNEETSVTSAVIEDDEKDKESPKKRPAEVHNHPAEVHNHPAGHLNKKSRKTIRIICVAVVMIFSLFLSMAVGVGLALWDSQRSLSELGTIVFAKEVDEAITEAENGDTEMASAPVSEEEDAGLDEVPDDSITEGETEEVIEDDTQSDPAGTEDDYGATIVSDTEGDAGVSQAGSDDEISGKDEDENKGPADPIADYPLPFTTVDESYFTDALFIGDSRLQGFGFWSGLPATYYCATGFQLYKYDTTNVVQTENGKVPIFDAMPYDAFTKIYIKVGLNELGYGTEANFEKKYAELIAKLREYEPHAIIYVHALLPVTAEKSASDKAHNNPNINERNAALKEFAQEQKAYFLDAGPVLSTADGSLRPEMTTDGIHLKAEYMKIWREFLCEHAIVLK